MHCICLITPELGFYASLMPRTSRERESSNDEVAYTYQNLFRIIHMVVDGMLHRVLHVYSFGAGTESLFYLRHRIDESETLNWSKKACPFVDMY